MYTQRQTGESDALAVEVSSALWVCGRIPLRAIAAADRSGWKLSRREPSVGHPVSAPWMLRFFLFCSVPSPCPPSPLCRKRRHDVSVRAEKMHAPMRRGLQVKSLQATIKALKDRAEAEVEDDKLHAKIDDLLGDARNTLQGTGPGGDLWVLCCPMPRTAPRTSPRRRATPNCEAAGHMGGVAAGSAGCLVRLRAPSLDCPLRATTRVVA